MWIPYWSQQAGLSAVLGHSGLFSTVSPFWYDARGGPAITRDPGGGDAAVVRRLRARGLAVVPTVASSMPPAVATRVLGGPHSRLWTGDGRGSRNLTHVEAVALRRRLGARRRWSRTQQAPWFRAGGRTVWYTDARSTLALVGLARRLGVARFVFWAASQEDPATWAGSPGLPAYTR